MDRIKDKKKGTFGYTEYHWDIGLLDIAREPTAFGTGSGR